MARLMFVGDISLGEYYLSFGHGPKSIVDSGGYVFENVHDLFQECDFLMGNLEGVLSEIGLDESDPASAVLRGNDESFSQLVKANFSMVSIANNHTLQHGVDCFSDMCRSLQERNILISGLTEKPITYHSIDGLIVAFISASSVTVDYFNDQYLKYDLSVLLELISKARKNCDYLIVNLHWGQELSLESSVDQKQEAQRLREAGVDLVIGHHPHVVQEFDMTRQGLIAYSLGHFVFDLPWDERMRCSLVLDVTLDKEGISEARAWPVFLDNSGIPGKTDLHVDLSDRGIHKVYNHSELSNSEIGRKLIYFFKHYMQGHTVLKTKFLFKKIADWIF